MFYYQLRNDTFCSEHSTQIRQLSIDLNQIELGSFCHLINIDDLYIDIYLLANVFEYIFKALKCLEKHSMNKIDVKRNGIPVTLGENHLKHLYRMCQANCLQELDLSCYN